MLLFEQNIKVINHRHMKLRIFHIWWQSAPNKDYHRINKALHGKISISRYLYTKIMVANDGNNRYEDKTEWIYIAISSNVTFSRWTVADVIVNLSEKKPFESKGRKKWKSHWFLLWIHCLRTFSHSQSFYCTSKQRFMGMAFSHLLYQKQHKLVNKWNIGCQGTNQFYGWGGFSSLHCQYGKSKEMTEYLAFVMGEFLLL